MANKYDFGTFGGAIGGIMLIVIAILSGGTIDVFLSLSSFLIVAGGTLATTFIAFHYSKIFALSIKVKFLLWISLIKICCQKGDL